MNAEKTGKLIAEKRKEKSLTQKQLAEMLFVSDKAVSRWETGKGFPEITILEDLAAALDISTAELLKGECIEQPVPAESVREMTDSSLGLFREILHQKHIQDLIIGFLVSAAVMILAFMHLNSPRYIKDPGSELYVEKLNSGKLIAVMEKDMTGWDISRVTDPDTGRTDLFISCYDTALNSMLHRSAPSVHVLSEEEEPYRIWYYPGEEGDVLLYSEKADDVNGGVVTLPRLIYNMWIALGTVISVLGLGAAFLARRKYYVHTIRKIAAVPVIFTLSIIAVIAGKADAVYNAQYYFSGILLLSAVLYLIFLAVYDRVMRRKQKI